MRDPSHHRRRLQSSTAFRRNNPGKCWPHRGKRAQRVRRKSYVRCAEVFRRNNSGKGWSYRTKRVEAMRMNSYGTCTANRLVRIPRRCCDSIHWQDSEAWSRRESDRCRHEDTEVRDPPEVVSVRNIKSVRDGVDFVVEVTPSVGNEKGVPTKDFVFRPISVLRRSKRTQTTQRATQCNQCYNAAFIRCSKAPRHFDPPHRYKPTLVYRACPSFTSGSLSVATRGPLHFQFHASFGATFSRILDRTSA